MLDRVINFFTSLRLTVVLLALGLILVFAGTIAQVKLGLYNVQSDFFRSLFVYWRPSGANWRIPVYPGGWLIGGLLLVNLIAAHVKRFKFSWKKSGIFLTHFGLILLLIGQFTTELFQIESTMHLMPDETKNYTEDSRHNELAIIDTTSPDKDDVVVIPESMVAHQSEIKAPTLPFTIKVKNYFLNSDPAGPMVPGEKIIATEGAGTKIQFSRSEAVTTMDDENKPSALLEIVTPDKGSLGEWTASFWLSKEAYIANLQARFGDMIGDILQKPQTFTYNGHSYQIDFRPIRYYKPYSITLLKFQHDIYKGTDIPKNFASRIHLSDPSRHEDRDVLIYMNNPLRYAGETFYQAGFDKGDVATVLQVVKNPAAATPYVACLLVALGLVVQFLIHLVGFAMKRTRKPAEPAASPLNRKSPEIASAAGRKLS